MWEALVTDLAGRTRAFLTDYATIQITPRLNSYREAKVNGLVLTDEALPELQVAARALKLREDGNIRFNGQLWEPLVIRPGGADLTALDPLATMMWRRTRQKTTYATQDAGLIAQDRVTVQNGYSPTFLRNGARNAAPTKARTYLVSVKETDILDELATAVGGFFYQAQPLDGVAGYFAELVIAYPDAGVTREGVRFEYGEGTIGNVDSYEVTDTLPLNRFVASSADNTGARIWGLAQDANSVAAYGMFEDEDQFADVIDTGLLTDQAQGSLKPSPPRAITLTLGAEAPVLFDDFNVGDFVRVKVNDGAYELWTWVRVTEATLEVDGNGDKRTSGVKVELMIGAGATTSHPERWFREQLDSLNSRLERLGRRIGGQNPGIIGDGIDPGGTGPPPEPPPPEPPPPPPAEEPDGSFLLTATWRGEYGGYVPRAPRLEMESLIDNKGIDGTIWYEIWHGAVGTLGPEFTPRRAAPASGHLVHLMDYFENALPAETYHVFLHVETAAGEFVSDPIVVNTPDHVIVLPP